MPIGRTRNATNKPQVVVLTADPAFGEQANSTFGASDQIELRLASGNLATIGDEFNIDSATVAVIDLDASQAAEMEALERLMARIGSRPPVLGLTQSFDETVA